MGCASRRLAVLVATLLPAANLAAAPAANPAAAIAAAAGHPALRHLRAETGWSRGGRSGTATLEIAGSRRLERECSTGLCAGTWFDGLHGWTFGINGTPFPLSDADDAVERTFTAIASTTFAEPQFLAAGGRVELLSGGGEAELRYRVSAPGGAPLVAVADPRTSQLTAVEAADGSPYRPLSASAGGAPIVYGGRPYGRAAAADGIITAPAGPPVDVTGERELPLLDPSLPVVPCSLGGQPIRCLLDTGTTPSAVTLDFAERLNREPYGEIEIGGLGTYLTGAIDAGPLALGGATIGPLHFAVIPRARGPAFDVVLGSDVLAVLRVTFEAGRRRVQLGPPADNARETPIALEFSGGLPFVEVRLGRRDRPEPMLLDTGDAESISIGYDEYRDDGELFVARGSSMASGLGGLPMDALSGKLDRAEIGGLPLLDVSISAVRGQHAGHVGYGLAGRCAELTVELGRRRMRCRVVTQGAGPAAGEP